MTALDFSTVLPEAVLAIYALFALMAGSYLGHDKIAKTLLWLTVVVLLAIAMLIGLRSQPEGHAFFGMFIDDSFSRFARIVILSSAAAVLAMSAEYLERRGMLRFEYPILIALAVIGMMVMVSAGDLMTLYMGLELQSLALYVLAAMRRESVKSSEAGLKYFVLGALSSGLLLYGCSLVYGFAGTTGFDGIYLAVSGDVLPTGLLFGLVFVMTGLAFKISAAPFHMWTPDVYEGAPTPVTAFFAAAPKMAAMALLIRFLFDAFGQVPGDWGQILTALAVLSMFLGSIAGIGQTDIKRLMAYSSIAHMGFALVGLSSGTIVGVQATLLYMVIYVVMNVGTFAFILSLERDGRPITELKSLNRLSQREPLKAFAVLILMFSMAGVPPMLGFWAKYAVLSAAVDVGRDWLAVLGVIASVIGAFYYLRIVYYMYFGEETDPASSRMTAVPYGLLLASAGVMILGSFSLFGVDDRLRQAADDVVAYHPAVIGDPVVIGVTPVVPIAAEPVAVVHSVDG